MEYATGPEYNSVVGNFIFVICLCKTSAMQATLVSNRLLDINQGVGYFL